MSKYEVYLVKETTYVYEFEAPTEEDAKRLAFCYFAGSGLEVRKSEFDRVSKILKLEESNQNEYES